MYVYYFISILLLLQLDTEDTEIETFFFKLMSSNRIAIILITTNIADRIRPTLEKFKNHLIPNVLEIPSKDRPYNLDEDMVIAQAMVKYSFYLKF